MNDAMLSGFFLGFITSSPLGPVGMLCLRRSLSKGTSSGLVSASGISLAYALWAYALVHGLTALSHFFHREQNLMEMAIGLFFIVYGMNGILNTPNTSYPTLKHRKKKWGEFMSTFLVVFLNPGTCVMFSILFTLVGISRSDVDFLGSAEIAMAVFTGSMSFWLLMSGFIHRTRHKLDNAKLNTVSRMSSALILIFGCLVLVYVLVRSM